MERAVIHNATRVVKVFTTLEDLAQLGFGDDHALIEFKDPLRIQGRPNVLLKVDGLGNLDTATAQEAIEAKHIAVSGLRSRQLRNAEIKALDAMDAAQTAEEGLAAMKA